MERVKVKAGEVPIGVPVRYYGRRVETPHSRDGHVAFEGGFLPSDMEVEIPVKRVTAPDEVPEGAIWGWRYREGHSLIYWYRKIPTPPDRPSWELWGKRLPVPVNPLGEGDGHVNPKEHFILVYVVMDNELDILTASRDQLVEEAVRQFGPAAQENARRTRLEQLREALQSGEAPEWWAITGGGDSNGPPVLILGRVGEEPKELTPPEVAKVLEQFFQKRTITEEQVAKMVDAAVKHQVAPRPVEVKVELPNGDIREVGKAHRDLPLLVKLLGLNLNVYLVGPAASFKTSSAEKAAKALGLPFYMTSVGQQTSKADLLGYQDAHGRVVRTHLRNAYEHGGVFLLDEVDAGNANVLTVINALLANNVAAFPDAMVKRHPNFRFIAAGNTFGRGPDRQYVGRNQLDAATLDRFVTLYWDYDEDFEADLAGHDQIGWTRYVQTVRRVVAHLKIRHIVSPRASIYGATLLRAGMERPEVEELVLWGPMSKDDRMKVQANLSDMRAAA